MSLRDVSLSDSCEWVVVCGLSDAAKNAVAKGSELYVSAIVWQANLEEAEFIDHGCRDAGDQK